MLKRFKPYWDRWVWDIKNIANDEPNPFVLAGEGDLLPKRRSGFEDIGHATKNLFVEGWRIVKTR